MNYPLLPYSQLVLELMEEVPGVYEIPVILRFDASKADASKLEGAVRAAIRNHPVLSMKLDNSGHHPCELSDEFHGPFHSVEIKKEGSSIFLTAIFNRILGDMTSLLILVDDTSRAYRGLELEPDQYLDYLQTCESKRSSAHYVSSEKWLEKEFGSLSCPVRPHTDCSVEDCGFKEAGVFHTSIPFSYDAMHREHLTPSGFVSLCTALAIMDYNGADAAALTWAYAGRDTLMEQRIFGSLHRDIPMVIRRSDSPAELFRQTRAQLRSGIAHSDFPYTLTHPHTDVWNYAVNVLHQPDTRAIFSSFPFDVEVLNPSGDTAQPSYSLLDIEISEPGDGSLDLLYRYSAAHYKKESVERFASLIRAKALWLLSGHHRVVHTLEEMIASDGKLGGYMRYSIEKAASNCPDRRMNPVRSLDDLYAFLDRFLVSKPWESLGLGEEMSVFRRIDQSTGYFLFLFDQPLKELEYRGYLYPSVQYIPEIAGWIKDFNNAWRIYLDSPASWDENCLEAVYSDSIFGLDKNWYEEPGRWHCWNDFFSRRLSGIDARELSDEDVVAPVDGVLQACWSIGKDNCLSIPEGVCLKTASLRSIADLLADSPFRDSFSGGIFVHQMLDFYDYHHFHCPVEGVVADIRTIDGISGSGGVVVWNRQHGRYEYESPVEPGFQMLETRGVAVIDAGELGLVAVVAVGMAQVCSVNWSHGLGTGMAVRKGDELGFFLCGGSDLVLLFQKNINLRLLPAPGTHLLMGNGLMKKNEI